jgi:hypothetical protein
MINLQTVLFSILSASLWGIPSANAAQTEDLVPKRERWRYYDLGDVGSSSWKEHGFDDSNQNGWRSGWGGFAYDDSTEISTVLNTLDNNSDKLITAYFRKEFTLSYAGSVESMSVDLRRDDGAVVYINGVEALRENMPAGAIAYGTFAASTVSSADEDAYFTRTLDLTGVTLNTGANTIAVEVHQRGTESSDLIFDLELSATISTVNAPFFTSDEVVLAEGQATTEYAGDISSEANDPDGDPLVFSKIDGPDWLTVAANGALSGTPTLGDVGMNVFTVEVTDNDEGGDRTTVYILVNNADGTSPLSLARRFRLVWLNDPSTTMTVAWEQYLNSDATVHYGTEDSGRNVVSYPSSHAVDRVGNYSSSGTISSCFARLSGLLPDTAYYFVIKDISGVSERYWFRTAPDTPRPFTFIAGGDTRTNTTPRRAGNRLIAKLRPLFVAFTGDYIGSDNTTEWNEWLDHWQESISSDGRMYPLLPHRGNHESGGNSTLYELFDITSNNYYAVSFGGNLLRYYVLNSETTEGGTQGAWLGGDLAANAANYTHLSASYHKPMRPHTSGKSEGSDEYAAWAQLFYDHRVDLVFESDSHTMKRTFAIRPSTAGGSSEGFIRDDTNGTVYVGEGCWGAPLRTSDDVKPWTMASGSFNGYDWVHVYPDYIELFTVKLDNADSVGGLPEGDVYSLPANIDLWKPASGARLIINRSAPAKKSYAQWQLDQWGAGAIPANSVAMADFDGDGHNNMTEFSFGLDPKTADLLGSGAGIVLPAMTPGEGGGVRVEYRRAQDISISYRYDYSNDLMNWVELVDSVDYSETVVPAGDNEQVEVQLIGSKVGEPTAFIRVTFGIIP